MKFLFSVFLLATLCLKAGDKPNIIVIMADDLGYHDLGFQGSKNIKTPVLDKLANTGLVFTDAHTTASVCSPSRAGFITGRYQQRFGHEANCPRGKDGMDLSEYTMGQAFQSLGYKTFLVGKWHLGATEEQYPTKRGFDEFWGLREGSRSYWYDPKKSDKPGNPHAIEHNGKQVKFEGYLTDRMTDQAISMIDSTDKPFFMFLSYTAPHGPFHAKPDDIKNAQNVTYWAMIQNMDENIGRLIALLEKKNIRENTLIWFLSDNGGTASIASNKPLNGKKGIKFEGGQRVPFIMNMPGKLSSGKFDGTTSAMDIFATSFKMAGGESTPKPLDGVDLMPFISGKKSGSPHEKIFWRKQEGSAVRIGAWKLIRTAGVPILLYNLKEDIGETQNLAEKYPEKAQSMLKELTAWEQDKMAPLWKEAKIYDKKRQEMYLHFMKTGPQETIGTGKKKKK